MKTITGAPPGVPPDLRHDRPSLEDDRDQGARISASRGACAHPRASYAPRTRGGTLTTILGLSGSLRRGSLNTRLLHAAASLAPGGVTVELASIRGIPLYDGDVEAEGVPAEVAALKDRFAAADGVLIVTPEYNNAMPGVLKNAIDWLSRPASDIERVFGGRPNALMGATPGRGATSLSQASWLPVLRTLGTLPWWGGRVGVAQADTAFDADGNLVDERIRGQVRDFVAGFAAFAAGRRA